VAGAEAIKVFAVRPAGTLVTPVVLEEPLTYVIVKVRLTGWKYQFNLVVPDTALDRLIPVFDHVLSSVQISEP
jgi:hypothetical protein